VLTKNQVLIANFSIASREETGSPSFLSGLRWHGCRPYGYSWSVLLIRSLDLVLTPLINVDLDDVRVGVDSMSRINTSEFAT
jgi:hypothetical protein